MKLLNIFSSKNEKEFAHQLAEKLAKDIPPVLMESRRKVLSVNKITRLLEKTFQQALEYQQINKLGFIGRAILANNLKWELKNYKYPDDFIDMATEGLVVILTKKKNTDNVNKLP